MTCGSCLHCDTGEAVTSIDGVKCVGVCTLRGGWFNGKRVPMWLTCPWFAWRSMPQADGDGGESHG